MLIETAMALAAGRPRQQSGKGSRYCNAEGDDIMERVEMRPCQREGAAGCILEIYIVCRVIWHAYQFRHINNDFKLVL